MNHKLARFAIACTALSGTAGGCERPTPVALMESPAQTQAPHGPVNSAATVHVNVRPSLHGEPFSCVEREGASMRPTELMLFVHDLEWVLANNTRVPVALLPDGIWQTERLALLDFAGTQNGCVDASSAINETLIFQGDAPAEVAFLSFRLGVPFELNHADPTTHSGPLTQMQMHWGWRGGYKFLRLEGVNGEHDVLLHLGSTGCVGPMTAVERCERPGQMEILVPWSPGMAIGLELAPLLDAALLLGHRCMGSDGSGMTNCSTAWDALSADAGPDAVWFAIAPSPVGHP